MDVGNRYTLGNKVTDTLFTLLNWDEPTLALVTEHVVTRISDKCEIFGGEFHGGWFEDGWYYGGEFHGGRFGDFHSVTIYPTFYDGMYIDGQFTRGLYYGGRFEGGHHNTGYYYGGSGHNVNHGVCTLSVQIDNLHWSEAYLVTNK